MTSPLNFYQIESTSKCSATCSFCPQPTMERNQEHIRFTTFMAAIDAMPNGYVALHHFGEPLLHPELAQMIDYAHSRGKKVEFSTNGKGLHNQANGDVYLRAVMRAKPERIRVAYDFFRPDEFIRDLLTFNVSTIITVHAVTEGLLKERKPYNNWAGQLPGRKSEIEGECFFLKYGYAAVLADGDVVPCCQDYEGKHRLGSVFDPENIKPHSTRGYDLCRTCAGMQFALDSGWWEEIEANQLDHRDNVFNKPVGELKDVPRETPRKRRVIPIKENR